MPATGFSGGSGGGSGGVVVNLIGLEQSPKETKTSTVGNQTQIDMLFEAVDSKAAEGWANGTSQLYAAAHANR